MATWLFVHLFFLLHRIEALSFDIEHKIGEAPFTKRAVLELDPDHRDGRLVEHEPLTSDQTQSFQVCASRRCIY